MFQCNDLLGLSISMEEENNSKINESIIKRYGPIIGLFGGLVGIITSILSIPSLIE